MLTFKNRFAEYDNLDDSYNANVLKNCYNREYRKNFFRLPKIHNLKNRYNGRYNNEIYSVNKSANYAKGYLNNNSNINSYGQSLFTPYQNLPQINNLYNNNNNNDLFSRNLNTCNSAVLFSYNNKQQQYNNNNNIQQYNNNINDNYSQTLLSNKYNNFSCNTSNDNINNNYLDNSNNSINESQIQENLNYSGNKGKNWTTVNSSNNSFNDNLNTSIRYDLNLSNDSRYIYNNNERIRNYSNSVDNYNKEQEILKGQEEIDKIENELKNIRQKRVNILNKKLLELQQLQNDTNINENNFDRNIKRSNRLLNNCTNRIKYTLNNNYNNENYSKKVNNSCNFQDKSKILKEEFNSNLINNKMYLEELIQEVNRLKLSQLEVNRQFQKKMDDLAKQNENIKIANEKMLDKIKDMKNVLNEKKEINKYKEKYLINKRVHQQKYIPQKKSYRNGYSNPIINFDNEYQTINTTRRKNNFADYGNNIISEDYLEYDKDVKNLLYDQKKNIKRENSLLYPYDKIEIGGDISGSNGRNSCKMELYNILRTDNGRLQRIKEIDENC